LKIGWTDGVQTPTIRRWWIVKGTPSSIRRSKLAKGRGDFNRYSSALELRNALQRLIMCRIDCMTAIV
jgi:hypothetical protein